MIKYLMANIKAAVQHFLGQVSILAQTKSHKHHMPVPKKSNGPSKFCTIGEDHFELMFGSLHTEMAILKVFFPLTTNAEEEEAKKH